MSESRVRVLHYDEPFNYSAVNNFGVDHSISDFLLFLNNDTEVVECDWLDEMVMWASRTEIGAVGAKLLRPDGRIQHAGIIVGLTGFAGHIFGDLSEGEWSWFGLPEWYRSYTAVTAACMMVRRSVFEKVGRFDDEFLLCGNDVELGIRINNAGYFILYNPFIRLIHLEGATRENAIPERDFVVSAEKYMDLLRIGDPYFNPNLSNWSLQPRLKMRGEKNPADFAVEYVESIKKENL